MPQEWTLLLPGREEVVSITLVHHFHTQTSTVQNVCPGRQNLTRTIKDGLVEVETVQVECHRAHAECGEPDANNRPRCEEEVQRTGVVKGCVLENKTTEVTVCGNDVVRLFFLTELVTIVLGLLLSSLADQEEVTRLPCIAEKRDPPNTPATPSIWNGCIRILCSAWKTSI